MTVFARLRRFVRDTRGMGAVEFALLTPVMLLLLFASVDLIDALGAHKRVENVAASLADVVARDTEVTDDEVTGLWAALDILMFPDPAGSMDVRVSAVRIESPTVARVYWSEGHNSFGPLTPGSTISLPQAMMIPGTSIVIAEAKIRYTAPLGFLFATGTDLRHMAYRRSRIVDPIERV